MPVVVYICNIILTFSSRPKISLYNIIVFVKTIIDKCILFYDLFYPFRVSGWPPCNGAQV